MKTIGFIGLGKLGLPVALAIEAKGFKVVGYDINPKIKDYLRLKKVPFVEEGITPLLARTKLQILPSIEEVVRKSDLVFCTIQTPHARKFEGDRRLPKKRADFDYSYLIRGIKSVVATNCKVTLVIVSTCLPGTYRTEIAPLLNSRINYIYNPLFIAMGTVIFDFLNPEFVLIGHERKNVSALRDFYFKILGKDKALITDITTAEGIKVFYNTFVTTKTVLGNMYGEFAHKMGMNVDDIYRALAKSTDRLISAKYLKSGVADGGSCVPETSEKPMPACSNTAPSRRMRVSLRVSMSAMATMPRACSHSGNATWLRQLLGRRGTSRTIRPADQTWAASSSCEVQPVLPTCG